MAIAAITAASSGDNTAVAAVPGKRIRVHRVVLSASGAVNAKFKDGAGTDLTGLFYAPAAGPLVQVGDTSSQRVDDELFKTSANSALVLNLSGAVAVGGFVNYDLI